MTPEQNANLAISHIFMGLMKIDGAVTLEEERKLQMLLRKLGHNLPGTPEGILANIDEIQTDAELMAWAPEQHLEAAFVFFDEFVSSGEATADHTDAVIDLAEVLSEVDGVSPGEARYLQALGHRFTQQYRTKR
ncbi:MAG: hypothetical protein SFY70_02445 [Bacteroidia bacterium]|nr:hypothetical protein [Bacteroidia bacterium]